MFGVEVLPLLIRLISPLLQVSDFCEINSRISFTLPIRLPRGELLIVLFTMAAFHDGSNETLLDQAAGA